NWGTWREVGMAAAGQPPVELQGFFEEHLKKGMSSDEGVEAFSRILGRDFAQVVVCTQDLHTLMAQPHILPGLASLHDLNELHRLQSIRPRPLPEDSYVAPANDVERRIANVWRSVLPVEQVGIHDSFFDLGGHSVLAIQVVSRLSDAFGVKLSVQE